MTETVMPHHIPDLRLKAAPFRTDRSFTSRLSLPESTRHPASTKLGKLILFDAHNHLQRFPDPDAIIAGMKTAGITGCIVNGTSESDWPQVAELAENHPDFVHPAFGLHPWFAHQRSNSWIETLHSYLDRFSHASVGECGLDRWIKQPDLDEQLTVFLPQLTLARERNLPITIHALKAWGPLLETFEKEPPPERGFLLHSFGGSPELVTQLTPLGAHFSFSGYFLHPRKSTVLDAYRTVPSDRLLLETDAPEMLPPAEIISHPLPGEQNHPANLASIATSLASHLQRPREELIDACTQNTKAYFNLS
ncbi:TatD family hydrolase [Haloferula sp.]|uniref:TatD family hydrolase n=1 Tax=Haloferula sp. TaxID=2497595 RepID=UPI00329F0BC9